MLSKDKLDFWQDNGYLVVDDVFSPEEISQLITYTHDIENLVETPEKWMIYYEKSRLDQSKILGRTEYFLDYHPECKALIMSDRLTGMISALLGQEAILFKEKINFKLAGSNGYPAHQDAPAWQNFIPQKFISSFIAIDQMTLENGCLYVLPKRHKEGLIADNLLADDNPDWVPIAMKTGEVLFFDAYMPHKSSGNFSKNSRRTLILTHSPKADGDQRDEYFSRKRLSFPPEIERAVRIPATDNQFNYFNPFN
ncbi:MAG: phytanoyl-CoA dioxygenase family protein [Saprospiraceae bacterium]